MVSDLEDAVRGKAGHDDVVLAHAVHVVWTKEVWDDRIIAQQRLHQFAVFSVNPVHPCRPVLVHAATHQQLLRVSACSDATVLSVRHQLCPVAKNDEWRYFCMHLTGVGL
jgi:hypothetical protein